jgi:hypothetical protein
MFSRLTDKLLYASNPSNASRAFFLLNEYAMRFCGAFGKEITKNFLQNRHFYPFRNTSSALDITSNSCVRIPSSLYFPPKTSQ